MSSTSSDEFLHATISIAVAYLSKSTASPDQLAPVLQDIHRSLRGMEQPEEKATPLVPAVPVRRSVKDDAVTCLECGKPLTILKGHLRVAHDLSVREYRTKWGLSPDYPIVAPAYARARSEAAKRSGLGRKPQQAKRTRKKS